MPKPPETTGFKIIPLPKAQTTVARCTTVIDVGTVPETYMGESKILRKIYIGWELPTLLAVFNEEVGEQPFRLGVEITFSTDDRSNFSKLVANWRNRPLTPDEKKTFDPIIMVNKPAMISFIHAPKSKYKGTVIEKATNENSVLKFNGIMPLPEGMKCPPMITHKLVWDWDLIAEGVEKFDEEVFAKIPKFIQEKMRLSDEYRKYSKPHQEDSEEVDVEKDEPIESDDWS